MASELSSNVNSRKLLVEKPELRAKSPKFITVETEFIGRGDIRATTNKHRRSRSRSGTRIIPSELSLTDETFYEQLDEYVKQMSALHPAVAMDTNAEPDVWTQLQQKESDLLLAAELGKALLDKNEELKKEQERLAEEYSKKLEVSAHFFLS